MSQLWVPGMAGPLEELIARIHRRIEAFKETHDLTEASVSVELVDGALHRLATLSAEPGFGFVTLCPHCDDGEPAAAGEVARLLDVILHVLVAHPPLGRRLAVRD